ncbi:GPI mannosyltransferase 1-like [Centruroides sculpturatus]|uniref:GPI mannosyltransferase 1-like n=1 Tax=Centruroides sculpturatus TaxID=218467 RepID=UPI000C6D03A0|nr:GPI mannosyltransferase 1-like [Centruroides sculpturatus]XP_023227472.1 GPI mannosyltransferase 1-like [Centruroides sculpturatus]
MKNKKQETLFQRIDIIQQISPFQHFILALMFRLMLLFYGEWQDQYFEVKFTDVDYHVFTDGASFVVNGSSPFKRHTYRYTPFLAYLLTPNIYLHQLWGKILFSVFDVNTGYLIYKISKKRLNDLSSLCCALLWLYNPLPAVVSTRGNAESIMSCLILLTIQLLHNNKIFYAGLVYGFSVHFKLYPIIYALSIYLRLSEKSNKSNMKKILYLVPNKKHFSFASAAAITFILPTFLAFKMYKMEYIDAAFLYHLTRKDIRHNFSPFFYLLYLLDDENHKWLSFLTFLPQMVLLIGISISFNSEKDLSFCIFIQTVVFVSLNKVCTSQYFLWYFCLMPIVLPFLNMSVKKGLHLFLLWLCGQMLWLFFAFQLEFKGINSFILLWLSSIIFYLINFWIIKEMIISYKW